MNQFETDYPTGMDMSKLSHIKERSVYNHNYYTGKDGDVLRGESDDDNTTEWYLIRGQEEFYLGDSLISEGDKLRR